MPGVSLVLQALSGVNGKAIRYFFSKYAQHSHDNTRPTHKQLALLSQLTAWSYKDFGLARSLAYAMH